MFSAFLSANAKKKKLKTHIIQLDEIYQQPRKYTHLLREITPFFYHFNRTRRQY